MYAHILHRMFSFTLSVTLVLLFLSTSNIRATSRSPLNEINIQPSGHGITTAQKVSTATTPQVLETASEGTIIDSTLSRNTPIRTPGIPYPSNVVNVPAASSTYSAAIEGIPDDNVSKPDANGSGGYYNYLETVNSELAIYNRSGSRQYTTSFQTWFGLKSTAPVHDPVVVWDNIGGRFLFSVDLGYELLLSVAQNINALGTFCNYAFPTPINGGLGADFDKLGVNSNGIYLTANILNPNTGNQVSNELFFVSRTQLETCTQNVSYTTWTGLTNIDGSLVEALVPAVENTANTNVSEYLVNSYPGGACQMTLWSLTSSGNLSKKSVTTQCYSPPPNARQKGSSFLIGVGDSSLTQVSYANGLLTFANLGSYNWSDGNGPVGIVEWYVLNPGTASISTQGAFGTPGEWLYYPSAVRNYVGNMLFVYNASGPSTYPSIWFVNQTLSGTQALAAGNTYYAPPGGSPWGDYQSAWLDSNGRSPNSVWITGEYAKTNTTWGTKFGLVTP